MKEKRKAHLKSIANPNGENFRKAKETKRPVKSRIKTLKLEAYQRKTLEMNNKMLEGDIRNMWRLIKKQVKRANHRLPLKEICDSNGI